ncbi:MAG: MarR family transcriptional regulator [Desulfobulbaceae bacterium]|nr:MarR family transcriptional regulator [Desulfobulbaceae bacterium]HIJ80012.1 MarR family transcriptional regulator [Deltaproteobacteria bacterium]
MECCKDNPLGRLIYYTAQEMRNFAEKILKPYDLTLEQLHLLKNMVGVAGLSQRQIGELANKTPANITRILDRLAAKGLIARKGNPDDRRSALVSLTGKGEALVVEVTGIFDAFSVNFLRDISEEEQQVIRNAFAKMSLNLKKMTADLEK